MSRLEGVARAAFLAGYRFGYERIARPIIFRTTTAQAAHDRMLRAVARLDGRGWSAALGALHGLAFEPQPVMAVAWRWSRR